MKQDQKMRALQLVVLEDAFAGCRVALVGIPEPGPNEVLIRVKAAALNFVDLLMTRGAYQTKPPLPFILGSDLAGEIVSVGRDVTDLRIGEPVMGMKMTGAFAEYALLPREAVRQKPEAFSFGQAAAFGAAYYTAYHALVRRAAIKAGEWLLVQGATGGVGLAAVDIARHLGARIVAVSGSPAKAAQLQKDYCLPAVIGTGPSFKDSVMEVTGGHGVDVLLDPVGGEAFREGTRCMAFAGRYLVVGFTSGDIPSIAINYPLIKGFSIIGVRAGEHGRRFPEHGRGDREAVWKLAENGLLSPRIDAEYPLEQWRAGFERLAARDVVGRIILLPQEA
jgi:NADPH2:quinone reductase